MLSKHAHKTNLSWTLPNLEDVDHFLVNQNTLISLSTTFKRGMTEHCYLLYSSINLISRHSHDPNMSTGSPWLPLAKFININPVEQKYVFVVS